MGEPTSSEYIRVTTAWSTPFRNGGAAVTRRASYPFRVSVCVLVSSPTSLHPFDGDPGCAGWWFWRRTCAALRCGPFCGLCSFCGLRAPRLSCEEGRWSVWARRPAATSIVYDIYTQQEAALEFVLLINPLDLCAAAGLWSSLVRRRRPLQHHRQRRRRSQLVVTYNMKTRQPLATHQTTLNNIHPWRHPSSQPSRLWPGIWCLPSAILLVAIM